MKKLFVVLLLVNIYCLKAQEYGREPDWSGTVVYIDSSMNHILLESQKCSYEQNRSASSYVTGVGKVKGKNCVNGSTSSNIIPMSDTIMFIAKHITNEVNPNQIFNIFRLEQGKGKRCIQVASAGTFSGTKMMDIKEIQFSASKYGESSYLIKITNLEQGEYSITFEGSRDQFNLFTIENQSHELVTSEETVSINDTVYFRVAGQYVQGTVESIEKYGVKAKYINRYDVERTKYVNFQYVLFIDPRK